MSLRLRELDRCTGKSVKTGRRGDYRQNADWGSAPEKLRPPHGGGPIESGVIPLPPLSRQSEESLSLRNFCQLNFYLAQIVPWIKPFSGAFFRIGVKPL